MMITRPWPHALQLIHQYSSCIKLSKEFSSTSAFTTGFGNSQNLRARWLWAIKFFKYTNHPRSLLSLSLEHKASVKHFHPSLSKSMFSFRSKHLRLCPFPHLPWTSSTSAPWGFQKEIHFIFFLLAFSGCVQSIPTPFSVVVIHQDPDLAPQWLTTHFNVVWSVRVEDLYVSQA